MHSLNDIQYTNIDTDHLLLSCKQQDSKLAHIITQYFFPQQARIQEYTPSQIKNETKRYELALLINAHSWDQQQRTITLGRLKNLLCNHVLVLDQLDSLKPLYHQEMLGFGFVRAAVINIQNHELAQYHYNIAEYNHKRSWNNAKNWANPENFDKYRW